MSDKKDDNCPSNGTVTEDAVFGVISEDGPNYRNVWLALDVFWP